MATLLKLVPPAATKVVIDYVLLGPSAAPGFAELEPVGDSGIAQASAAACWSLVVTASRSWARLIGLWSRWQATRTTKRVQVAVRRKVFEHAMRLPLHRVYQLKSGGASSLLREDAGGVGELIFSMLYNPWRPSSSSSAA